MTGIKRTAALAVMTLCTFAAGVQAAPLFAAEGTIAPTTFAPSAEIVQPLPPQPPVVDQNAVEPETVPAQKFESLAAMVADQDVSGPLSADEECMAIAIYFESRAESLEGQHAVAAVLRNRAASGRFPSSVCGVVKQRGQFSFVRGGTLPSVNRGSRDWREAVAITRIAMDDAWDSAAPKALFFHARRVSPGWRLTRVATVGNHVFYR